MAQFATENIRTVALVGDGASGKTTLAEALLARAGAIPVAGSVERGSTVSDFDPLEKTYQHSLRASLVHLETGGTRIHIVDTPGFPDFIGQAIGALDAVETAAVVVNAAAGVQMVSSRMMDWAAKRSLCRLVVVNRIDAENVDLPGVLAAVQSAFGKECLPINLPAGGGSRVVDCFFNPSGDADFSSVADAHRALVDQVGACELRPRGPIYASLFRSILFQQLAGKAAAAIHRRVCALFDGAVPAPEDFLGASEAELRAAGLSRQKLAYLKDLAAHFADGRLRARELARLPDVELIRAVTAVHGVGEWTAHMLLIFSLGRPDILPVGDYGVRKGMQQLYRLRELPKPAKMERVAAPWRPYRSIAAWYMWRSLDGPGSTD